MQIVSQIVEFSGRNKRQHNELFSSDHVKAFSKKLIKGFKGVENIYTQHIPELKNVIEDIFRGRLKETSYPFLGTILQRDRPSELIIFIIGGLTYEESMVVHQMNKAAQPGVKIIIGGSMIHNSASFLNEVRLGCDHQPYSTYSSSGGKQVL